MRKLLVITGGTKGIGRAIIEKFIVNGFDVATCAHKQSDLDSLKNTLGGDRNIFTFQADVSDRIQAQSFCEFVQGLGRPVDVLVNNAGYFVPGEISTEPEETLRRWCRQIFIVPIMLRSFVHAMKEQRNGHIVNICSIASIKSLC